MRSLILAIFLISTPTFFAFAQNGSPHNISLKKSTGNKGTGANIDVKYHRFTWSINPTQSKRISGSVTTYFKTTTNNVKTITFDLNKTSFNNSSLIVKYHGTTCTKSFPSSGYQDILSITLPVTLGNNILDSVTIFYDGVPPGVVGQAEGCQQKTINTYPLFYTLSESYEDKDWWPCKADMQDKIDSTDFIITTPSAYRPAANGVLVSEVTSGANKVYTFKHRYPIASYLVAVAVTQYDVYNRGTANINGTLMPVEYYISKGRNPSSTTLKKFDYCKQELEVFSELFGDYPFKNEKYGMYEFGWGGGMEHQTFSAMGWGSFNSTSTVAHELMHQWFGDKVTMATWNHLWLAEGFASYGEVLAGEFVPATGIDPTAQRGGNKTAANGTSQRGYSCILPNNYITSSDVLWSSVYGSSVYDRGGMVVSMLRTLLGDAKFFQACRNYLNDPLLAYQSATTDDLRRHMEAVCDGYDLSGFFNSFVYGNGYPTYSGTNSIKWTSLGSDRIVLKVDGQSKSTGSNVGYYSTPIPLRVQGAGGQDTVIVIFDEGTDKLSVAGNGITPGTYSAVNVYLGFKPTSVSFDPYNQSLANGITSIDNTLPVTVSSFDVKHTTDGNVATVNLTDSKLVSSISLESSNNGTAFKFLGNMHIGANSTWNFTDANSYNNYVYYRAKVIMVTGEIQYSAIVKISSQRSVSAYSILENPVHGKIQVMVPASESGASVSFTIFDLSGRKMLETTRKVMHGLNEISCNIPKGNYVLRIDGRDQSETLKFLVD